MECLWWGGASGSDSLIEILAVVIAEFIKSGKVFAARCIPTNSRPSHQIIIIINNVQQAFNALMCGNYFM